MSAVLRFTAGPPGTRFVLSPLWEVLASIRVLQNKQVPPLYRSWVEETTRQLGRHSHQLDLLFSLVHPVSAYTPSFLFVPPLTPVPDLAADLAGLQGVHPTQVRNDLNLLSWILSTRGTAGVPQEPPSNPGPLPDPLAQLYRDPAGGLEELVGQIEDYWKLAIAPRWGRIRARLADDLTDRGRTSGLEELFDGLPGMSWQGRSLTVDHPGPDATRELAGTELLLMPSAFVWPDPWPVTALPHQPRLTYPVQGLPGLWDQSEPSPIAELTGVLGNSRTRLLAELATPLSTSELAARTALSVGGASQHLAALRAAGLVSSHRSGHSVLYSRTAAAETLLTNPSIKDT